MIASTARWTTPFPSCFGRRCGPPSRDRRKASPSTLADSTRLWADDGFESCPTKRMQGPGVSEGAESSRLAQGVGFGLMNAAWAVRAVIGPAAAGTIAGATGDAIPFVLAAASCVAALVFMR